MDTERGAKIWVIRWSARVLGVIFAGFFLFMAIGESLQSPTPIKPLAAIWLGLAGIYAVAMFLALKWERAGRRSPCGKPARRVYKMGPLLHPTLYFWMSAAGTSLLIPGSSGAATSPSIIFRGPLVSM